MNGNNDNREYIKKLFDDDGIKAPESLSEDSILKMLEAEDAKPAADPSEAKYERKNIRPHRFAKDS